ncbi:MAG: hypothetical protein J7501_00720 [Bdellovibrio sp.]|nr:hypothetical protein [Bdellovibrio sp.]
MKRCGLTLLICSSLQLLIVPAIAAAPVPHVSVFSEVQTWGSVLSVVTAATGSDKFEKGARDIFKKFKTDLNQPFVKVDSDGSKVHLDGVEQPLILGATPYEFTYQGVNFIYNPKRSVKHNFEEMVKNWGGGVESRGLANVAEDSVFPKLFTYVGMSAALADSGVPVGGYFGFKWFKASPEPIKLECLPGKISQIKGKDRLVIETLPTGQQVFFSEEGGQKGIQGELEKITLRGKESYAITNGNETVNELRIADAMELNKKLMAMKTMCANPEEVEQFNSSSRRIQEAINSGKIKVAADHHAAPSVKDPDSVSGVR